MTSTQFVSRPLSAQTLAAGRRAGIGAEWCASLARQLVDVVNQLWRRQASRIPELNLDAYLSMRWLRWEGGALVLTTLGQSVHDDQLRGTAP
jgi:hypothetical protein